MKDLYFKNKVVVITGASSGIGRACAIQFAKEGAHVVIAARSKDKLELTEKEILSMSGAVLSVKADVSSEDECKNLIHKTIDKFGKIDILINNAGISMRAMFEDVQTDVIKKLMDINFYGMLYCTKYALPYILKEGGSLIGVSSLAGITPLPGRTGYSASKHAMNGFLRTLRVEYLKDNLHVLIVHPGFTSSNIRFTALNKEGLPQKESPRNESQMMSSEEVARHIIKAIRKRKREIVLTTQGKILAWLYKRCPTLADILIYREMKKEEKCINNA
ncbi:MAG: putative oxidoreductase [Bacteroidetes bacterium ADurb.Bin234]|nr:MAG: putative oxidoreductase [Bacteroidetes bacterium ADurb.Bin234]